MQNSGFYVKRIEDDDDDDEDLAPGQSSRTIKVRADVLYSFPFVCFCCYFVLMFISIHFHEYSLQLGVFG
jgi:hypothetical protein